MNFPRFLFVFLSLLFVSACTSPQKRIRQNQAAFDQFPAAAQNRVRLGNIAIGDTRDMVRIAKGEPNYVTVRETKDSEVEVWRWTQARSMLYSQPVHFHGRGVPSPQIVDVREFREVETLRVEFVNGEVIAIEELRP